MHKTIQKIYSVQKRSLQRNILFDYFQLETESEGILSRFSKKVLYWMIDLYSQNSARMQTFCPEKAHTFSKKVSSIKSSWDVLASINHLSKCAIKVGCFGMKSSEQLLPPLSRSVFILGSSVKEFYRCHYSVKSEVSMTSLYLNQMVKCVLTEKNIFNYKSSTVI